MLRTDLEALKVNREAERAGRIRAEAALRKAISSDAKEEDNDSASKPGDGVGRKGIMIKEIGEFLVCVCLVVVVDVLGRRKKVQSRIILGSF